MCYYAKTYFIIKRFFTQDYTPMKFYIKTVRQNFINLIFFFKYNSTLNFVLQQTEMNKQSQERIIYETKRVVIECVVLDHLRRFQVIAPINILAANIYLGVQICQRVRGPLYDNQHQHTAAIKCLVSLFFYGLLIKLMFDQITLRENRPQRN